MNPPSSDQPAPRGRAFLGTDRFEIRAQIGQGATGTVYRAYDRELEGEVALKTMRRPGPDAVLRMKQEFRSRAGIVHPNLVQLHELFVTDDLCFFTMELIAGDNFLQWARQEVGVLASTRSLASGTATSRIGERPHLPVSTTESVGADATGDGPVSVEIELAPPVAVPERAWDRLRHAFAELVSGLDALHGSGRVHRDVKPANVLVGPGDRVVILDFGLVADLESGDQVGAGTPAYMAPEQFLRQPAASAMDLYAVGVILYETLTGLVPFSRPSEMLAADAHVAIRPAGMLAPYAPRDLADLAMDLLSTPPAGRPGTRACLARLTDEAAKDSTPRSQGPFVGRIRELSELSRALWRVAEKGHHATVHVHGASGTGKSRLVRECLVRNRGPHDPLVFHARCHPQESVPYKAIDAAVDGMARWLDSLPPEDAEKLVPPRAYALLRLFPVLAKAHAFEHAPAPDVLPGPIELQQLGFSAMRDLVTAMAQRRTIVVWLDDVQWGDADSALLLDDLVRGPAPPFLLVLCYRSEERERSAFLRHILHSEASRPAHHEEIALAGLDAREVEELARTFLDESGPAFQERLQAVVDNAQGNPFIAGEMARYVGTRVGTSGSVAAQERLEATRVVLERVAALSPPQRTLIEIASIGGPVDREIALTAAGVDSRGRPLVAMMRDANLLRELSAEGSIAIAAYHDRIREIVVQAMPAEVRSSRHRALAEALTARGSRDYEALLLHWDGAGDKIRAGRSAVKAAERAARALAFDHATDLYEKSLVLLGADADRANLLEQLGHALANRGRAPEAAVRFLEAAREIGGPPSRRVNDLKRRAAEQYMKSGRIDDGWKEMKDVLEAIDVPVPRSVVGAMGAAAARRVLFLVRPLDVERHVPAPATPEEQHHLDVLWSVTTSWTMLNPNLADAFRVMHLHRAIRSGNRSTLCRSLAFEAAMEIHLGGKFFERNVGKLLAKVESLVHRTRDPYDQGWLELTRANIAYTQAKWHDTVAACKRADALFREQCSGAAWETVAVGIYLHFALAMLGEMNELRARLPGFNEDAKRRGDAHALCEVYINEPVLAWLADDRGQEAREQASSALAIQSPQVQAWPQNAYRRQQYADLVAAVYEGSYRGDPWPAWQAVTEQWKAINSAFLLPLRVTGLWIRLARARAALAGASTLRGNHDTAPIARGRSWTREALLDDVRGQLKVIAQDQAGCAEPAAALVRAGLARLGAGATEAASELLRAVEGFDREGMALYREAARFALGHVRGGAGVDDLRRAEDWMAAQGVVKPAALTAAMVPGVMRS